MQCDATVIFNITCYFGLNVLSSSIVLQQPMEDVRSYGTFTLHGTRISSGNRNGTGNNGLLYITQNCSHCTRPLNGLDSLSSVVPVLFPVPVPFPVPCSVNVPLFCLIGTESGYSVHKNLERRGSQVQLRQCSAVGKSL